MEIERSAYGDRRIGVEIDREKREERRRRGVTVDEMIGGFSLGFALGFCGFVVLH